MRAKKKAWSGDLVLKRVHTPRSSYSAEELRLLFREFCVADHAILIQVRQPFYRSENIVMLCDAALTMSPIVQRTSLMALRKQRWAGG
jgi:hypothetical protein